MSRRVLAVVDYGAGNLRSVVNALESLGTHPAIVSDPAQLASAHAIVLPGVGAFGDGMRVLKERGLVEALDAEVRGKGKPYLGVCLGMQFLADVSEERGRHEGFGWIPGAVVKLNPADRACKVPHMGWNALRVVREDPLFEELAGSPTFYFVHGYRFAPRDPDAATSLCWHGEDIVASVRAGHIFGVQFHPEKSQQNGVRLLSNFVKHVEAGAD
jgi:imidazole glycerol-phosphate synthase subunit HisH